MVRCYPGIVQYEKWMGGAQVPSIHEFERAGFCDNTIRLDYSQITDDMPLVKLREIRLANLRSFSFAIPSSEALDIIASLSPLVEVGAGTGCWSRLLLNRGVDVMATDAKDRDAKDYVQQQMMGAYAPVEKMSGVEAVTKYPGRNVLSVWPCRQPWMTDAAKAMQSGSRLIMIHEGRGGCIGDDMLFDYLLEAFFLDKATTIPHWPGVQDRLGIWTKIQSKVILET